MHPLPLSKHKEPLHGDRPMTERAMPSLTGAGKALRAESELALLLSLVKPFPLLIVSSPTAAFCADYLFGIKPASACEEVG